MSDFLRNLVGRELGGETGLRPRLPSLFEREPVEADAIEGSDAIESPAIEREAQPLPWRRLSTDMPMPAESIHASVRTQAQPQDPASPRTRTRPAETPQADEPPLPAARARRSAAQGANAAPGPDGIPSPAPHRAAALRPTAMRAEPSPPAATAPRIDTAPQPVQPTVSTRISIPVSAQHTRIAIAETDPLPPARKSRATTDAHADAIPTPEPRPAPAQPPVQAAMPMRSWATAQKSASAAAEETVIQVSIGRIEVRATPQTRTGATTAANGAKREAPRPVALEDYLRERQGRSGS